MHQLNVMEFIKNVERFVELHQNIITANQTLKDSKKEKTMLKKQILEYMMTHHILEHHCDGFVVINKETERKGKLEIEFIQALLENVIDEVIDQVKYERIINAIIEGIPSEIKNSLSIKKFKPANESKEKKSKKTDDHDK